MSQKMDLTTLMSRIVENLNKPPFDMRLSLVRASAEYLAWYFLI